MKFVSYILEDEQWIHILNTVGLVIFIAFFIGVLYRTYKMPKSEADEINHLVFEDDDEVDFSEESEVMKQK
jgi:cbb3-type cytochrome oxidase subunit 3